MYFYLTKCPPNNTWACFVHYLEIINTILKNNFTSWSKLSEKLMSLKFQQVKLLSYSSISKVLFLSIPQLKTCLAYKNFSVIFEFLKQFASWCLYYFSKPWW